MILRILTADDLNKMRGPSFVPMMTNEDNQTIYEEVSPIDYPGFNFYRDLENPPPHILVKNGPWFHRLCLYWMKNTIKTNMSPEIAELMPDAIPIFFTKLTFLMLPRY